jgi:hypothetical protein
MKAILSFSANDTIAGADADWCCACARAPQHMARTSADRCQPGRISGRGAAARCAARKKQSRSRRAPDGDSIVPKTPPKRVRGFFSGHDFDCFVGSRTGKEGGVEHTEGRPEPNPRVVVLCR